MPSHAARYFISCLYWFLLSFCVIFGCRPSVSSTDAKNPSAFVKSLDSLLVEAASNPPESLQSKIALLPPAFQDSFFIKRLLILESAEDDNAIKSILKVFESVRPGDLFANSLEHYYFGIFNQYAGKFDSAEIHYIQATKGFEQLSANYFLAQTLDKHSGCLTTRGRTDDAVPMKYRSIALLNAMGETKARIHVQMHLANVFNLKGAFDRAIVLLEEPAAFYEAQKDTVNLAYILALKGTAYLSKGDFQTALSYHKTALAMRQRIQARSGITESLFHVGRTLLKMNAWQEALDTLRVAENLLKQTSDKQGQAYIETGIGEALFNLGRFVEADSYLIRSLDLSVRRKQYPAATIASQRLSAVRKAQNRFAEALQYNEQFAAFRDSVFNQEKDKLSRELFVKYETLEKELQITALMKEKKLATQRNWWIVASMFLISAIAFYALRLRSVSERQRLEIEKNKVEAQSKLLINQLEMQQLELDANRIRLEDYAGMLIERNQQLQELSRQIESGQPVETDIPAESSDNLYNHVILTESDWEKFQTYFNKVYPGFIAKLRGQYTDLSPAEMRLVLLDKMGLSLKESCTILGISIDAVKKGRYRLKKKYNLDVDDLSNMI